MNRPARPAAVALAAVAVSSAAWTTLQAGLAAVHAHESAAVAASLLARQPGMYLPDTSVRYWGPLVLTSALGFTALAVLALVFVRVGRRISWALILPLLFVRPEWQEAPISWARPIGFGWSGAWVQTGTGAGETPPSLWHTFRLANFGTVVDIAMITLPAVVYLLATRREPARRVVPALTVVRRVGLPLAMVAFATIGYGVVNLNGGDSARTIPALVVPLAAALLATTRLRGLGAVVLVTVVATAVSPAAAFIVDPVLYGHSGLETIASVAGYAVPLAALATVGALSGVHGPAIASAYRRLVRRPRPVGVRANKVAA